MYQTERENDRDREPPVQTGREKWTGPGATLKEYRPRLVRWGQGSTC